MRKHFSQSVAGGGGGGKGLTTEVEVVGDVLKMLQGFSTSHFHWDHNSLSFVPDGLFYLSHLSFTPLYNLLSPFLHAASCLHRLHFRILRLHQFSPSIPTLSAFASHASLWLKRLRDIALNEEMKMHDADIARSFTLLGLTSSVSSLCSGAEYLFQLVHEAIPDSFFESNSSLSPAKTAAHILDYLYYKLDQLCLVQHGENNTYKMVLHIFVGCLLPYVKSLDSWLFEGMLDDPCEEMFFYANKAISVEDSEFWEKSYQLRQVKYQKLDSEHTQEEPVPSISSMIEKEQMNTVFQVCPLFIRDIATSIVSAGKSLQLIRHVPMSFSVTCGRSSTGRIDAFGGLDGDEHLRSQRQSVAGLTLYEIFCISVAGLIGHGDHVSRYFLQDCFEELGPVPQLLADRIEEVLKSGHGEQMPSLKSTEGNWSQFLVDVLLHKKAVMLKSVLKNDKKFSDTKEECMKPGNKDEILQKPFRPENPVLTVCQNLLDQSRDCLEALNISRNFNLPHLGDESLREAIFGGERGYNSGTDYVFGFRFDMSEHLRLQDDVKHLEGIFPFPTLLPSFQDEMHVSEFLPFQNNSSVQSRILRWVESAEARTTPHPLVIMQECLTVYIKKQVDYVGRLVLSKLMNDWRLMDELAVLRATYLLGSGDLLHHFFIVIFSKLDKGESLDDEFELNTVLQESIRNSADGILLSTPDSLIVSIIRSQGFDSDVLPSTPTHKSGVHSVGLDGLESLKFTYKVPWPLELIANAEAIKKYNQVMGSLLKVKRAKFVLDKARRWMWKGRSSLTKSCKHHWLVEQKLLHFVDAFHQYVMDRVYHSSWRELCERMAAAGSLDEVIEIHEAYLLSIQRQCFVVPDKLWALIASRINTILGLALDFYSTQQTLSSSGAASAMKAKCEMEVDRIEKQFDDCISFLLRVLSLKLNVGHFPHLADLVTRINYNYFYMSESGSLKTSTGSEMVSSKFGKAYGAGTG